jgi:L-rhamnose isomerase
MPTFPDISDQLAYQAIELPSWAFGNSGTRFKVFGSPGTPRTIQEKLADAAKVNELTGLAPKVALHIPWDKVEDYGALRNYAADLGVALGTVNSNTFPGRHLQVRQPHPCRRGGTPQGDRSPSRVHRDHEPDRITGPEDLAC